MSRVLACLIAVAAVAAAVTAVVVSAVAASRGARHSLDAVASVLFVLAVAAPAAVGLFVALRRPGYRVPWILLIGSLSVGVVMAADAATSLALSEDRHSAAA